MAALLRTPTRRWAAFVLLLTVGGFDVYRRSLTAHFVGDDAEEILRAAHPGRYPRELSHPQSNLRPLAARAFALNEHLAGLRPWTFHVVNVAMHVVVALLVALVAAAVVRRWGGRRAEATGMAAGALFLVMPNHTEAVSWIAARADLMATACCLLATLAWLRSRATPAPRARIGWSAGACAAFALALGCKESAITLPLAIAVLELASAAVARAGPAPTEAAAASVETADGVRAAHGRAEPGERRRPSGRSGWLLRALLPVAPFVGVLAAYLVWRRARLGVVVGSYDTGRSYDWDPIRAAARLVGLVGRSIVPAGVPGLVAAAVVVGAVLWSATRARAPGARRLRPSIVTAVAAGAAMAALALPVAGLGVRLSSTQGERLVYLPSTVAAMAVAAVLLALPLADARRMAAVAVVVVVVSAALLASTDGRWKQAGDLAHGVLERSPAWDVERPLWVLNPPDALEGGAYVTRNALAATAILEHGWHDPGLVRDLTAVRFAGVHDRVRVVHLGGRRWRLDLLAAGARFEDGPGPDLVYRYDGMVASVSGRSLTIRLEGADPHDVWYVDDGRLVPLLR